MVHYLHPEVKALHKKFVCVRVCVCVCVCVCVWWGNTQELYLVDAYLLS